MLENLQRVTMRLASLHSLKEGQTKVQRSSQCMCCLEVGRIEEQTVGLFGPKLGVARRLQP